MEQKNINQKIVKAFVSLSFRKIILDAISFLTLFIFLAKILPVSVIGIFGIANAILVFFSYFSDVGLAAALIQKKEITKNDLKTTFFVQEILAISIFAIIFFSAPYLAGLYNWEEEGMWLIRALGFGFFLTSLKVIPSVLLERELKFSPIVWVDILEAVAFNGALVFFVFQGLTIEAFTIATVLRGIVGALAINLVSPWDYAIGLNKESLKSLVNFGIPFQANSVLALLKDRLTPLITGKIIGDLGMGYVTWAQGVAFRPQEVMNIVIRITFPAFSRLQDDPKQLKSTIEQALFMTTLFLYPMLFGILAITPNLIEYLGDNKWGNALPLVYLFSLSTFWAVPSTTYTNVLNGVGKIKTTLKLMVMWTGLTWVLSPLFAIWYGYLGVGIAAAVISFTSLIPIVIVNKMYKIDLLGSIWKPLLSSLVMGGVVYFVSMTFVADLVGLIALVGVGAITYFVILGLLAKSEVLNYLRRFNDGI